MPKVVRRSLGHALLALLILPAGAAATSTFQVIGGFSGTGFIQPWDISGDGRVVVGDSGGRAYSWSASAGLQELAFTPGAQGSAFAASHDGSVVVGSATSPNGSEGFVWRTGAMTGLGDLAGGQFNSQGSGVSADGSLIVGAATSGVFPNAFEATVWNGDGTGLTRLSDIVGGGPYRGASAVSADGLVIAGNSRSSLFRVDDGNITLLGFPNGASGLASILGISADGSTMVGRVPRLGSTEAFLHGANGFVDLGFMDDENFSVAYDVSGDGSVVVGYGESADGPFGGFALSAFVWDATHGMRKVTDVMAQLDVSTDGWHLTGARGISDDGSTIVGYGTKAGLTGTWILTIPEPTTLALLAAAALTAAISRIRSPAAH